MKPINKIMEFLQTCIKLCVWLCLGKYEGKWSLFYIVTMFLRPLSYNWYILAGQKNSVSSKCFLLPLFRGSSYCVRLLDVTVDIFKACTKWYCNVKTIWFIMHGSWINKAHVWCNTSLKGYVHLSSQKAWFENIRFCVLRFYADVSRWLQTTDIRFVVWSYN